MSDPQSPEAREPETPASEGVENGTPGGEQSVPAGTDISHDDSPPKARAYVDPEIAAEARQLEWEAEKADLTDKLMRAHAEMDNLRKRSEREKADMSKYAITKFAGDMLAVADNLERALDAMPRIDELEPHTKALVEGVQLTGQDLRKAFERYSVMRIDALHALFDPNLHQAVMEEENKEVAAGTVTRVLQEGYRIGERVLRPSMVVVARGGFKPVKPAADPSEDGQPSAEAADTSEGAAGQTDAPSGPERTDAPTEPGSEA